MSASDASTGWESGDSTATDRPNVWWSPSEGVLIYTLSSGVYRNTAGYPLDVRPDDAVPLVLAAELAEAKTLTGLAERIGEMWHSVAVIWGPPVSTLRELYPGLTQSLDALPSPKRRGVNE